MGEFMLKVENESTLEKSLQGLEQRVKNLRVADMEIFISAAHMQSLGKAAKSHYLSQSATSTAVQRVEQAFQVPLCTHERRQFKLTREGEMLLPKIEHIVAQIRSLIASSKNRSIRVVTTHAIAQMTVPAIMNFGEIEFAHMRPDQAYAAIVNNEADLALVLDNSPWKGVLTAEISRGGFALYAKDQSVPLKPVLLPEEQMEVISLKESWRHSYGYTLPVKSTIPSWSLIGQICSTSDEVGFLPDFLAKHFNLKPVSWQPEPYLYRILALYRKPPEALATKFAEILERLIEVFSQ